MVRWNAWHNPGTTMVDHAQDWWAVSSFFQTLLCQTCECHFHKKCYQKSSNCPRAWFPTEWNWRPPWTQIFLLSLGTKQWILSLETHVMESCIHGASTPERSIASVHSLAIVMVMSLPNVDYILTKYVWGNSKPTTPVTKQFALSWSTLYALEQYLSMRSAQYWYLHQLLGFC